MDITKDVGVELTEACRLDAKIYLCYGRDARQSTLELMERADVAARIPAGASIALKPNLVVAKPPETGATTHAGVLEGALEYLHAHGFQDVSIIEGSWVGDDTLSAMRVCGYDRVARRFGAPIYDLKRDETRAIQTAIGKIKICRRALDAGYLINLPVLKGHCQTRVTCALKNLKGCLPDAEKRRFHALGLHRPIAALAAALRPALTIVDGLCGDLNFEEGGTPVTANRMLLGEDMVKLDALGCRLMGIDPDEIAYIGLAERFGAGDARLEADDLIELGDPRQSPALPRSAGAVARLTRGVRCESACSACYANLCHALYQLDEEGLLGYCPSVAIGQGLRGAAFDGVGVGNCAKGARVPVPGCPPRADEILKALRENLRH